MSFALNLFKTLLSDIITYIFLIVMFILGFGFLRRDKQLDDSVLRT